MKKSRSALTPPGSILQYDLTGLSYYTGRRQFNPTATNGQVIATGASYESKPSVLKGWTTFPIAGGT
jgi:Domain of unknown function (DUF1508)